MPRLTKRDVEALLRDYDDDPVAALTVALRRLLDSPGELEFDHLVDAAPLDPSRRDALRRRDPEALDDLVAALNEERALIL